MRTGLWLLLLLTGLASGCAAFDDYHPDDDAEDYGYKAEYQR